MKAGLRLFPRGIAGQLALLLIVSLVLSAVFFTSPLISRNLMKRLELKGIDFTFEQGKIKPYVSSTYPLERAADALNEIGGRRAKGKIVVIP